MSSQPSMKRASVSDILLRLEVELARAPGSILASATDGTLWDGDVRIDIFEAMLARRGFRAEARAALAAEARALGVPEGGDANATAEALYRVHQADRYPHERACAMMAWSFAGHRRNDLRAFADEVLDARGLSRRIRPELTKIFQWARDRGVDVFVVSTSPFFVVEAAAARLGIAADHVAAATPLVGRDGMLHPDLAGPIVRGAGKLEAIERAYALVGDPHMRTTLSGATANILAAFGAGAEDAAMLRAATLPVAVPPAPKLIDLGPTIPGFTVLDR